MPHLRHSQPIPVTVPATDGVPLDGRLYASSHSAGFSALLLPGIGVPQRALRHLGTWLASHGVRALSIDYRGMGRSPAGTDGATLTRWAERDAVGALNHLRRDGDGPVVLFAHSFGGQAIGFSDELRRVRAAVLFGSQLGHPHHWSGLTRLRVEAYWRLIVPSASLLLDPLPGWTGLGHPIPRGVAQEWAGWGRSPDWLLSHVPLAAERYARFDRPILACSATDDDIAPPRAVADLLSRFSSARIERMVLSPAQLGVDRIGHMGLLRPAAELVWRRALAFARTHAGKHAAEPTSRDAARPEAQSASTLSG